MPIIGVSQAVEISRQHDPDGIGLSAATIKHAAAKGEFAATKIGKTWTFSQADFEVWLPNQPKPMGRPKKGKVDK